MINNSLPLYPLQSVYRVMIPAHLHHLVGVDAEGAEHTSGNAHTVMQCVNSIVHQLPDLCSSCCCSSAQDSTAGSKHSSTTDSNTIAVVRQRINIQFRRVTTLSSNSAGASNQVRQQAKVPTALRSSVLVSIDHGLCLANPTLQGLNYI